MAAASMLRVSVPATSPALLQQQARQLNILRNHSPLYLARIGGNRTAAVLAVQRQGIITHATPHAVAAATAASAHPKAAAALAMVTAAIKPATATVGAGATALHGLPTAVSAAVLCAIVYTGLLFLMMIVAPRAQVVRHTMRNLGIFAPLALTYLVLLVFSWTPDTLSTLLPGSLAEGFSGGFKPQFFPKLSGIAALFSQPATAASWVLHILAINLFLARTIYLDGTYKGIPTPHSLALASVAGPLGLVSHWLTKAFYAAFPSLLEHTRVLKAGDGSITILPYQQ